MSYVSEVLADSPLGYWRLDEPSGTTAASTVNSPTYDGTYRNTPTLGVSGALIQGGDSDTAVALDRASSEDVALGAGAEYNIGDIITIEAWVKRASITVGTHQIYYNGGNQASFRIDATTNLLHVDKAAAAAIMSSTVAITDTTTWHHCVYTKDGATNKIYLDGVDVSGTVTNATMVGSSITDNFIGSSGANYFDGSIDEVAIYSTALSAARVLAHYTAAIVDPNAQSFAPVIYGRGAA